MKIRHATTMMVVTAGSSLLLQQGSHAWMPMSLTITGSSIRCRAPTCTSSSSANNAWTVLHMTPRNSTTAEKTTGAETPMLIQAMEQESTSKSKQQDFDVDPEAFAARIDELLDDLKKIQDGAGTAVTAGAGKRSDPTLDAFTKFLDSPPSTTTNPASPGNPSSTTNDSASSVDSTSSLPNTTTTTSSTSTSSTKKGKRKNKKQNKKVQQQQHRQALSESAVASSKNTIATTTTSSSSTTKMDLPTTMATAATSNIKGDSISTDKSTTSTTPPPLTDVYTDVKVVVKPDVMRGRTTPAAVTPPSFPKMTFPRIVVPKKNVDQAVSIAQQSMTAVVKGFSVVAKESVHVVQSLNTTTVGNKSDMTYDQALRKVATGATGLFKVMGSLVKESADFVVTEVQHQNTIQQEQRRRRGFEQQRGQTEWIQDDDDDDITARLLPTKSQGVETTMTTTTESKMAWNTNNFDGTATITTTTSPSSLTNLFSSASSVWATAASKVLFYNYNKNKNWKNEQKTFETTTMLPTISSWETTVDNDTTTMTTTPTMASKDLVSSASLAWAIIASKALEGLTITRKEAPKVLGILLSSASVPRSSRSKRGAAALQQQKEDELLSLNQQQELLAQAKWEIDQPTMTETKATTMEAWVDAPTTTTETTIVDRASTTTTPKINLPYFLTIVE